MSILFHYKNMILNAWLDLQRPNLCSLFTFTFTLFNNHLWCLGRGGDAETFIFSYLFPDSYFPLFFFFCLFFGFYKETQENSGFIIFLCDKCTCLFHCLKVRTNLLFRFFSSIFPPFQFTFVSFVQFTVVSSRQSIFN